MFFDLRLNKIALLLIMVTALFTACQKESTEPANNDGNNQQNVSFFQMQSQPSNNTNTGSLTEDDSLDMDCFSFVYPLEVVLPGGDVQTANNDDELEMIVLTWLDQNPTSNEFPTFNFPIDVMLEDGTTQSVANEEALCELLMLCWDGIDDIYEDSLDMDLEFCFELVYPIEVVLPDQTTATANSDEELETIIFDWYEANPDSEEFPTFTYPIQVDLDGEILTVNSDEELEAIFEDCHDGFFEDCFSLNYPVQIIFPDGTTAEVDSDMALETVVEEWYEQNPTSEEDPTFAYPVEVTLVDGTVQSIGSDEEFDALFEACYDDCEVNGERLLLGDSKAILTKTVVQKQ